MKPNGFNTQHSTLNFQLSKNGRSTLGRWMLGVGCWMLTLLCLHAASVSSSKPWTNAAEIEARYDANKVRKIPLRKTPCASERCRITNLLHEQNYTAAGRKRE